MPSNFHSAIQSDGGPSVSGISATGRCQDARERTDRAGRRRALAASACATSRDQRREIRGGRRAPRLGIADHALRHAALVDAGDLGQRLHDLSRGDADPQLAGDQLEEGKPLVGRQRVDLALSRA